MTPRPETRVLRELIARLESLGLDYALGGSIASGAWGQPRYTNDIDVAVLLTEVDLSRFLAAFEDQFMLSEAEFREALASGDAFRSAQLLHLEDVFKVDVFLPNPDPFTVSSLQRARPIQIAEGVRGRCLSPEDVIVHKLRWYELGRRVSDRQWNDIVQVIEVQGDRLDRDYVLTWARHFGLEDLAREAFSEALPPEG